MWSDKFEESENGLFKKTTLLWAHKCAERIQHDKYEENALLHLYDFSSVEERIWHDKDEDWETVLLLSLHLFGFFPLWGCIRDDKSEDQEMFFYTMIAFVCLFSCVRTYVNR